MTASQECKAIGIKSLAHACKIAGVHRRTVENWHINKPKLFKVFLHGVKSILDGSHQELDINLLYFFTGLGSDNEIARLLRDELEGVNFPIRFAWVNSCTDKPAFASDSVASLSAILELIKLNKNTYIVLEIVDSKIGGI